MRMIGCEILTVFFVPFLLQTEDGLADTVSGFYSWRKSAQFAFIRSHSQFVGIADIRSKLSRISHFFGPRGVQISEPARKRVQFQFDFGIRLDILRESVSDLQRYLHDTESIALLPHVLSALFGKDPRSSRQNHMRRLSPGHHIDQSGDRRSVDRLHGQFR